MWYRPSVLDGKPLQRPLPEQSPQGRAGQLGRICLPTAPACAQCEVPDPRYLHEHVSCGKQGRRSPLSRRGWWHPPPAREGLSRTELIVCLISATWHSWRVPVPNCRQACAIYVQMSISWLSTVSRATCTRTRGRYSHSPSLTIHAKTKLRSTLPSVTYFPHTQSTKPLLTLTRKESINQ